MLFLGWLDNARSPFFPDIIHSMQLNPIQGSLFFAITSLISFSMGFFNDRLLKHVSSLQLLQAASALLGLGFFLMAWSPNFILLLLSAAVYGLGYGSLNFSQNVIIQEWAPSAYKRRIFVGLHSMYGIAALLAPISASAFYTIGWPWRKAFLMLSVLPVALAFISRRAFAHPPKSQGIAQEVHVSAGDLSRSALWIVALSVAFYMFGEIGVSTRIVLLLRTEYAQSPETANTYLAIFFGLLLLGRLTFALLDFKHLSNRKVLITSASLSAAVLSVSLALHRPFWIPISGLTMAPFYPVGMNYLAETFGTRHAARSLSFGIALCSLATVVLQLSLGVLTESFGLESAMWIAPAGLLCCVAFLWRPVKFNG
jgi:MFS family permease